MDIKQLLLEGIKSWWSEPLPVVKERSTLLARFFDPKIKKVIAVIGFRRVGKTFTLFDFAKKYGKERCIYLNFEDERIPPDVSVLTQLIDVVRELKGNKPFVLLLDEIQQIPDWNLWARRVNETTLHHLIISGSSSKLSSREIPTELRGQTLSVEIFPLSWREFLQFKSIDIKMAPKPDILNSMREYLLFGGLPEIVLSEEGLKPLLLTEYYNTFVLRDVIERNKLRNTEALRDLLRLILNTRYYTYTKLANTLKSLGHDIGKATVIRYMNWLESSFFLSNIELCSPNIKRRIQAVKKAYVIDTYFCSRFSSQFSQNIGQLMEQAVLQHLERKKFLDPLIELGYWKDYANREVDFVVMKNQRVERLVQVSYATSQAEVSDREIKPLIKAAKELECLNLELITWNYEGVSKVNEYDVRFIPIWQWLIEN